MADVTLYDLVKDIRQTVNGKAVQSAPSIVDGLAPAPIDLSVVGLRELTPAQLLSLKVPVIEHDPGGKPIEGFQRFLKVGHARRIARAIASGKEMPPGLVSIDEDGNLLMTDAQHRSVAHIIERKPFKVVIEYRTRDKAQQLFADQKKGAAVDNDTIILAGHGPFNEYIQDAVTDANHPWFPIAGPGKVGGIGAGNKISPFAMKFMLVAYVGDQAGTKGGVDAAEDPAIASRWDEKMANELADLVGCFGTKTSRPAAFTSVACRSLAITATLIIRRHGRSAHDIDRWKRWMPLFDFERSAHLTGTDMTDALLNHWNKRLKSDNKVYRPGR